MVTNAFCMFPRSDGYVISAVDIRGNDIVTGSVKFHMYEEVTGSIYNYHIPYLELDEYFRFHVELMNPLKRKERYAWIAARLQILSNSEGLSHVELNTTKVADLEEFDLCTNESLPSGRYTEDDYRKIRESHVVRDSKREQNIVAKDAHCTTVFLRHLEKLREAKRLKEESKALAEQQELLLSESFLREKQVKAHKEALALSELESLRESNISKKLASRKLDDSAQISNILKSQNPPPSAHPRVSEQTEFEANLRHLESKREIQYEYKAKKIYLKSLEYLKRIRQDIAMEKRMQKIKHEKRQLAAYNLNLL